MSDGIHNLTGEQSFPIRDLLTGPDGETQNYTFTVATLDDYGEKEAYILSLRPDPWQVLTAVPAGTHPSVRTIMQEAVQALLAKPQFATRKEESDFNGSTHGMAWEFWRSLRDNHEEFGKPDGKTSVTYRAPNGKEYTIGPSGGIRAALRFIQRNQQHQHAFKDISRRINESGQLGNSPGPAKSEPGSETTGGTPSPDGPAD